MSWLPAPSYFEGRYTSIIFQQNNIKGLWLPCLEIHLKLNCIVSISFLYSAKYNEINLRKFD